MYVRIVNTTTAMPHYILILYMHVIYIYILVSIEAPLHTLNWKQIYRRPKLRKSYIKTRTRTERRVK